MKKQRTTWFHHLLSLDVFLGVSCLCILVLVTFFGAIMRYFFNNPLVWQEEVQVWMILWTVFSGASYVFRNGVHVSIEILVEKFPARLQTAVEWLGFFCTTAALTFVCYHAVALNLQFLRMGKCTPMLRIPSYIIYSIVPIGCAWMIVSYLLTLIQKYFGHKEVETE